MMNQRTSHKEQLALGAFEEVPEAPQQPKTELVPDSHFPHHLLSSDVPSSISASSTQPPPDSNLSLGGIIMDVTTDEAQPPDSVTCRQSIRIPIPRKGANSAILLEQKGERNHANPDYDELGRCASVSVDSPFDAKVFPPSDSFQSSFAARMSQMTQRREFRRKLLCGPQGELIREKRRIAVAPHVRALITDQLFVWWKKRILRNDEYIGLATASDHNSILMGVRGPYRHLGGDGSPAIILQLISQFFGLYVEEGVDQKQRVPGRERVPIPGFNFARAKYHQPKGSKLGVYLKSLLSMWYVDAFPGFPPEFVLAVRLGIKEALFYLIGSLSREDVDSPEFLRYLFVRDRFLQNKVIPFFEDDLIPNQVLEGIFGSVRFLVAAVHRLTDIDPELFRELANPIVHLALVVLLNFHEKPVIFRETVLLLGCFVCVRELSLPHDLMRKFLQEPERIHLRNLMAEFCLDQRIEMNSRGVAYSVLIGLVESIDELKNNDENSFRVRRVVYGFLTSKSAHLRLLGCAKMSLLVRRSKILQRQIPIPKDLIEAAKRKVSQLGNLVVQRGRLIRGLLLRRDLDGALVQMVESIRLFAGNWAMKVPDSLLGRVGERSEDRRRECAIVRCFTKTQAFLAVKDPTAGDELREMLMGCVREWPREYAFLYFLFMITPEKPRALSLAKIGLSLANGDRNQMIGEFHGFLAGLGLQEADKLQASYFHACRCLEMTSVVSRIYCEAGFLRSLCYSSLVEFDLETWTEHNKKAVLGYQIQLLCAGSRVLASIHQQAFVTDCFLCNQSILREFAQNRSKWGGSSNQDLALGLPPVMKFCDHCGRLSAVNLRCSRCKNAWYCNVSHQKSHWRIHRRKCQDPATEVRKLTFHTIDQV